MAELIDYAGHKHGCRADPEPPREPGPCSCGFEEVVKAEPIGDEGARQAHALLGLRRREMREANEIMSALIDGTAGADDRARAWLAQRPLVKLEPTDHEPIDLVTLVKGAGGWQVSKVDPRDPAWSSMTFGVAVVYPLEDAPTTLHDLDVLRPGEVARLEDGTGRVVVVSFDGVGTVGRTIVEAQAAGDVGRRQFAETRKAAA